MPASDNKLPDPFSKSQIKRDMQALEDLGGELIALSKSQLATIPLPDELLEAIQFAHTLKSNGARKRHLKYVGKMIRDIDREPIEAALLKIKFARNQQTKTFHEVEQWREDLIKNGDEALQKFCELYPDIDRQQLRQLIRHAQHERANNKNTGKETALFRYLKEVIK